MLESYYLNRHRRFTINQWLQGLSAANNAANLMTAVGDTKKFNKFVRNKFYKDQDDLFRRKGIANNILGGTTSLLSVSASLVVAQLISQRDDLQLQLNECKSSDNHNADTCRRISDQIDLMDRKINYTVVETSLRCGRYGCIWSFKNCSGYRWSMQPSWQARLAI